MKINSDDDFLIDANGNKIMVPQKEFKTSAVKEPYEVLDDINQIDQKVAVRLVGCLPDLLLPKGIEYTEKEKKTIKAYKYFYRGKEEWLKNLVLQQALNPDAIFTNWQHFQSHAQIDTTCLELISGLHPRAAFPQEWCPEENAPIRIWLQKLAISAKQVFKDTGLPVKTGFIGKATLLGKDDFFNNNIRLLDKYNEHSIRINVEQSGIEAKKNEQKIYWNDDPEQYLIALASDLASRDEDFDKEYWQPCRNKYRHAIRKIRGNKALQAGCLLPNGELFITGLGKKIPKSVRGKKGFR